MVVNEAIRINGDLNGIEDWSAYAYNLALLGKTEESERAFERLLETDSTSYICNYFRALAMEATGDDTRALKYMMSAYDLALNPLLYPPAGASVKGQRDYFVDMSEREHSKFLVSLLSLLLLSAIFALIAWQIHKRNKEKEEKYRNDCVELVEKITSAKTQLDEMETKYQSERERLRAKYIQLFRGQFHLLETVASSMADADLHNDKQLKYEKIYETATELVSVLGADTEKQQQFEEAINDNLYGVMSKYKKDFPDRKNDEYRFVSYLFAGLSANLISTLFGLQSVSSTYMRKQRIKTSIINSDSKNKQLYLELLG